MLHDIVKASAEAIFYHVCKGLLFVFTCELYMKSTSVVNKHNWEFLVNPEIKRNCFNSILRYSKKLFYSADICQHSQTFWSSLEYFSSTFRSFAIRSIMAILFQVCTTVLSKTKALVHLYTIEYFKKLSPFFFWLRERNVVMTNIFIIYVVCVWDCSYWCSHLVFQH